MTAWPFFKRPDSAPAGEESASTPPAGPDIPRIGENAAEEDIFIPSASPSATPSAPPPDLPPVSPDDLYVPEPPAPPKPPKPAPSDEPEEYSAPPAPPPPPQPPPPPEPPLVLPLVPTELEWVVPCAADRIDRLLAALYRELSRVRWQKLIEEGHAVTLNGKPVTANNTRVRAGDRIHCTIPPTPLQTLPPQDIPLDVHYEDNDILILAKQPGLVVHPAPGHEDGTLANALMNYLGPEFGQLDAADRPGLVHRLDKDTSGLLVIAKTAPAMRSLKEQFSEHTVRKEYLALVWGAPVPARGLYDAPIARHPTSRKKMAVNPEGRPALTYHTTLLAGPLATLQRIRIETGRTHQIRVHFSHDGHPVCGDTTYGRARPDIPRTILPRQMLHACRIRIIHPRTGDPIEFTLPPPPDFLLAADALLTPPPPDTPARAAYFRDIKNLFPRATDDIAALDASTSTPPPPPPPPPPEPEPDPVPADGGIWSPGCGIPPPPPLNPKPEPKPAPDFPIIGKIFSNHWKTRTEFFQSLETSPIAGPDPVDTFPEVRR